MTTGICAGLLLSCSTPSKTFRDNSEEAPICDGNKPGPRITLYFSLHTQPPSGVQVNDVGALQDQTRAFFDTLSTQYFQNLFEHSLKAENGKLYCLGERNKLPEPPSGVRLVRTSIEKRSFAVCNRAKCDGLVDPVSRAEIHCESGRDSQTQSPTDTCEVSGISPQAPRFSGYGAFQMNSNFNDFANEEQCFVTGHGGEPFDDVHSNPVWGFVYDTGVNPGLFMRGHYLSVPDMERDLLCRRAGAEPGCLVGSFPEANDPRRLWGQKPTSTFSEKALELILTASTKTTTKVEGAWVVRSFEFDPTLMCKYARPNSDLVTH